MIFEVNMTRSALSCPRCGASMSLGILLDRGDGNIRIQAHWVEGKPEKSWFTGSLKLKDRQVFAVESYRCDSCGFLESYANQPPSAPWWA